MPFAFSEAYEYCTSLKKGISPDEMFVDYINWGGLPQRFSFSSEGDIKKYVEQTYQGILNKDIITDNSKINRQKFEKIAEYIMAKAGKEFTLEIFGKRMSEMQIRKGGV